MRKIEIYLIRHGTTEWNKQLRLQGKTDTCLDPIGIEMARYTGLRFRELGITFDRVYSSPLRRAFSTALLAAGLEDAEGVAEVFAADPSMCSTRYPVPVIADRRLEELGFGKQEGRRVTEMTEDASVPFRYFKEDPAEYDRRAAEVDAETLTELCARTADFLRETVELPCLSEGEETPERILISGHGACNKGLLMHIRGDRNLDHFWAGGLQKNCGVDRILYEPETGRYTVLETGRIYYPENLADNYRSLIRDGENARDL